MTESDLMNDVAKTLWKIVSEKCHSLTKFIVPKELSYCSTMDGIILSGQQLTHLTLKRNVPNNFFLTKVGQNCPNLQVSLQSPNHDTRSPILAYWHIDFFSY